MKIDSEIKKERTRSKSIHKAFLLIDIVALILIVTGDGILLYVYL